MQSMSLNEIRDILERDVARFRPANEKIKATYSDYVYLSPSRLELAGILEAVSAAVPDHTRYVDEIFDCDDFSFMLKGQASLYGLEHGLTAPLAIGMAWGMFSWRGEFHAANWAVMDGSTLVWIEPQDLDARRGWGLHPVDDCRGTLTTLLL